MLSRLAKSKVSYRHKICNISRCASTKTDSFIQGLYTNKLITKHVFPYPSALTEERTEDLSMFVDSMNQFFVDFNDADANDKNMQIADLTWEKAKEYGSFGILVPEEYGGMGMNNTEYARLSEVIISEDMGFSIAIGAHQSIGYKAILLLGNQEQKDKYLPKLASGEMIAAFALTEPSVGSDAASVKCRAVLSEDESHYILNGNKIWISNGGIADVMTVFAKTPTKQPDGTTKDLMNAFIVERNFGGVTSGPPENKMGIKASNTTEVFFEDCKIPKDCLIGKNGDGFKIAMEVLNNGRFGMSSGLCGVMRKCIAMATEHASQRVQFANMEIHNYGAIQEKISRMSMTHYAAESMAYLLCASMDNKAANYELEAACCKIFSSEAAWNICDESIQILGGMGYMRSTGLERIMRDLRIFRIFEGTNDILRLFIALTGIKHLGGTLDPVKNLGKSLKSFNVGGISAGLSQYVGHQMKSNKMDSYLEGSKNVSGDLSSSTKLLDAAIKDFQFTATDLTMNYQKKVIAPENQMMIRKLADSTISIYSCAAVLSRATRAIERGDESADHEKLLAATWVKDQTRNITTWLKQAREDKGFHGDLTNISKNVVAKGTVVQEHPLGI